MGKPVEFARTGTGYIDAILAEIESTAQLHHNVNEWYGSADERRMYVDLINERIEYAAKQLNRLQGMLDNGLGPEDVAEDPHPNWNELTEAQKDEAIRKAV